MNPRIWIVVAGLLGASGVGLGAYHAHGLEEMLETRTERDEIEGHMNNCGTAVRYHMFHALALLGVGLLGLHGRSRASFVAGTLLLAGTLCFSGGLYVHVFTGKPLHWAVVPSGGVLMIAGWIALAVAGICGAGKPADGSSQG